MKYQDDIVELETMNICGTDQLYFLEMVSYLQELFADPSDDDPLFCAPKSAHQIHNLTAPFDHVVWTVLSR